MPRCKSSPGSQPGCGLRLACGLAGLNAAHCRSVNRPYIDTFIAVAPDTRATAGTEPVARGGKPSIATLEFGLVAAHPYRYTQEDVQFAVHAQRQRIDAEELAAHKPALWREFFAKPMACMRTSPLAKSYGWGLHFDGDGKLALVPMESAQYRRLQDDPALTQTRALRSKRA